MTFSYQLVDVAGDVERRGFAYGQAASALIAHNADHYRSYLRRLRKISPERLTETMDTLASELHVSAPAAMAEVAAIAEGAGLPVADVLLINARSEALHDMAGAPAECTTVAVTPERSTSGHTLLAQNWDWLCGAAKGVVLLRVTDEDGTRLVSLHEAGMLVRGGFNSHGVGVVGNFLASPEDRQRRGVPLPFSGSRMLRAQRIADVVAVIYEGNRTISTNYLTASAEGLAIDVETTPTAQYPILPTDGLLVHANHYQSEGVTDTGIARVPDTFFRDWRLRGLLAEAPIGVDTLQTTLADRRGAPAAISRTAHGPDPDMTLASMIMDLDDRTLFITDGPPSERPYHELHLDQPEWQVR